jgi:hypothetical protein
MKYALILFLLLSANAMQLAVTDSGRKVVVKNDGTWENYNPKIHKVSADMVAVPKADMAVRYLSYYEAKRELEKDLKRRGVKGKAYRKAMAKLHHSGMVQLMMRSHRISTQPTVYKCEIKNHKDQVLIKKELLDVASRDSDYDGFVVLGDFLLRQKPVKELWLYVLEPKSRITYQFNIPIP